MAAIDFDVSIGSLSAQSGGKSGASLLSLTSEIGAGAGGSAVIEVRAGDEDPPKPGDPVSVTFDKKSIFTGEAISIKASPGSLLITAVDKLGKLERAAASGAYAAKTAGAIAKDIFEQAGVDPGTVEDGPTFESYVLGRG